VTVIPYGVHEFLESAERRFSMIFTEPVDVSELFLARLTVGGGNASVDLGFDGFAGCI
jgi:hypothetical protein